MSVRSVSGRSVSGRSASAPRADASRSRARWTRRMPSAAGLHVDVDVQPVEDVAGDRLGGRLGELREARRRRRVGRDARLAEGRQHRVRQMRREVDQWGVGLR
ncbi:hypothetical protein [Actinomadura madurae]|uniref:hypothetical protein n=1 Tax=Actinomadura madurae TaxID=1993 RepID=UPI0020D23231|nr:hypothetical protein [Actinomadura madurae]MCQ0004362.1 hypothetical protein [Actinomadura madurae]